MKVIRRSATTYFHSMICVFLFLSSSITNAQDRGFPEWFINNLPTSTGGESVGLGVAACSESGCPFYYVTGYFAGKVDFANPFGQPPSTSGGPFPLTGNKEDYCGWPYTFPTTLTLTSTVSYKDAFIAKYRDGGRLVWAKKIGSDCTSCSGQQDVSGIDVTVDGSGNPVVTGYFKSDALGIDGGIQRLTSSNSNGSKDIFVMKFDASGNYINGVALGSPSDDEVSGIVSDNSNNIYICGSYQEDIEEVVSSNTVLNHINGNNKDIFVIKIPSNNWSLASGISKGGTADDEAYDIAINGNGTLYTTGYFESNNGDFNGLNHGNKNMFLCQVSSSFTWGMRATMGGNGVTYGKALAVKDDNIYVTGSYAGVIHFGSSSIAIDVPSTDNFDVFVFKFHYDNSSGLLSCMWKNFIRSEGGDEALSIAMNGDGPVVTAHLPAYTPTSGPEGSYTPNASIPYQFVPFPSSETSFNQLQECPDNTWSYKSDNAAILSYTENGCVTCPACLRSTPLFLANAVASCCNETVVTGAYRGLFRSKICQTCPAAIPPCNTSCPEFDYPDLSMMLFTFRCCPICTTATDVSGNPTGNGTPVVNITTGTATANVTTLSGLSSGTNANNERSYTSPCILCPVQAPDETLMAFSTPCSDPESEVLEEFHEYHSINTPCTNCIRTFELTPDKKYLVSAWVKQNTLCSTPLNRYCFAKLRVLFYPLPSPNLIFQPSGQIIDGWQRIQGIFTVPSNATSVQIRLLNMSGNSSDEVYYDDIRVHPFDANMKSYVYDPVSLKLVSELDENNYATFYEYDEEGKLTRVKKETERGIMTIKESRVNTKKP